MILARRDSVRILNISLPITKYSVDILSTVKFTEENFCTCDNLKKLYILLIQLLVQNLFVLMILFIYIFHIMVNATKLQQSMTSTNHHSFCSFINTSMTMISDTWVIIWERFIPACQPSTF